MTMDVVIIKYNAGNIRSVDYGLKRLNIEPVITDDPERIIRADRVIFPGQGEASTTMRYLRERRLDELIKSLKQPVLGICIGMQLLCRHSEEGDTDCLGVFDAEVKRFIPERHEDKIPHMGWNTLTDVRAPLFDPSIEGRHVYFVHSYYVDPQEKSCTAGATDYGIRFTSAAARDNIFAIQFHPEKSAQAGLALLSNFVEWTP